MYCPQCGQQQASGEMRFCSRCGFPLGVISEVLARGGGLTTSDVEGHRSKMSPRQRGVRQGAMMMLSALLVVPLMVFAIMLLDFDRLIPLVPLSAVVCVVGGFIRIAYALMFEEAAPPAAYDALRAATPFALSAQLNTPLRGTALPHAHSMPVIDWQQRRPETAEILQPPSVTENTTRLLEKESEERGGRGMRDEN